MDPKVVVEYFVEGRHPNSLSTCSWWRFGGPFGCQADAENRMRAEQRMDELHPLKRGPANYRIVKATSVITFEEVVCSPQS